MNQSNIISLHEDYVVRFFGGKKKRDYFNSLEKLMSNNIVCADIISSYWEKEQSNDTLFIYKKNDSDDTLIGMIVLNVADNSDPEKNHYEASLKINDYIVSFDTNASEVAGAVFRIIETEIMDKQNKIRNKYNVEKVDKKIIINKTLESLALTFLLKQRNLDMDYELLPEKNNMNKDDLAFAMAFARMNGDNLIGIGNGNPVYITHSNKTATRDGLGPSIDHMCLQMRPWWSFKDYVSEDDLDYYEDYIKQQKAFTPYINVVTEVNLQNCLNTNVLQNPFENKIWPAKNASVSLDKKIIDDLLKNGQFEIEYLSPVEWRSLSYDDARDYHHKRVAMMVDRMGNEDRMAQHPLHVTVNKKRSDILINLEDGHHRLSAMIYMNNKTISLQCKKNQSELLKEGLKRYEKVFGNQNRVSDNTMI